MARMMRERSTTIDVGAGPRLAKLPTPPRSPWQLFYGWVLDRRRRAIGKRAQRLPVPVVSVGNLHFGGSGKTPLTAALAGHLRDRGYQVAVLSRGYGRRRGGARIVSRGDGPLVGPGLGGDEPVLLAGLLHGVAVVVAENRYEAGELALEALDPTPTLFLLDDGFSHYRLARDVDILVFPAAHLFAGGRLAPSGRLREPLAAVRYADAVVVTGTPQAIDDAVGDGQGLAAALAQPGFAGPGFEATTHVTGVFSLIEGEPLDPKGRKVLAVSAVADERGFLSAVESTDAEVAAALTFRDHHAYPDSTLEEIRRVHAASGTDAVITTAKDGVKLFGRLDLPVWELRIESRPEPAMLEWLVTRVESAV